MTTTTHPEFHTNTEALEVAKAFANNIRGKTVVITGVNRGGIGFSTAEAFASQSPAFIILTGRTLSKLEQSIAALKETYPAVTYRPLVTDLGKQQSVRQAAAELLSWTDVPTVDILVNSAGVFCIPERTLTEDGIELTFATNHVGHFLFTSLIMPKLLKAAETAPKGATRIINVSAASGRWAGIRWGDHNFEKVNKDLPAEVQPNYEVHRMWGITDSENASYLPLEAYNQTKIANVLFSIALTNRLYNKHGILSLALHPGVIKTELGRTTPEDLMAGVKVMIEKGLVVYKSLGAGAATSLVAALDPALGPGVKANGKENYGIFLADCQVDGTLNPRAESTDEAEKLWALSEKLTKEEFVW